MSKTNPNAPLVDLVANLPEAYQPIYQHPELSSAVSRSCKDRLEYISVVHGALRNLLGRPVRVLDLGCAQGFFSLSLAVLGAKVHGVDYLDKNIEVCHALVYEFQKLEVTFECNLVENTLQNLMPDQYDLVIGLSVFHHLCHQYGKETVHEWVTTLMKKVGIGIFELALASEPLNWAKSLPEDARYLLDGIAFVHELSRFPTHLSGIMRPLYVCSNQYWYFSDRLSVFDRWTTASHSLVGGVNYGTRRYFFGDGKLAKVFQLTGLVREKNLREIEQEARFLASPPPDFSSAPTLFEKGSNEYEAWIVRGILTGELLIDLIQNKISYDSRGIIIDVLDQLCALEEVGLYHNDVRVWNVIVGPNGRASLIDFGAISREREDCVWPSDLILSFFIFVRDVATGNVDRISPLRQPFISPYNIPEPFNRWILNIWQQPVTLWNFKLLRDSLKNLPESFFPSIFISEANALWMQAVERYLDALGAHTYHIQTVCNDLENREKTLQNQLATQIQRGAILETELSQSRAQNSTLREIANIAQQHARHIEGELTGVYHSLSWRMTKPLREAKLRIKRLLSMVGIRNFTLTNFPRRVVQRALLSAMWFVQARPELKDRVARFLAWAPFLNTRLRALHRRYSHTLSSLEEQPSSQFAADPKIADRFRRQLEQELIRRKQIH